MKIQTQQFVLAAAVMSALVLGGCGRRGPLEPHPDAPPEQRTRAQQAAQDGQAQPPRIAVGGSRRTLSSPIAAPDQPFILDPLL